MSIERRRRQSTDTRLERFINSHGLKPAQIARKAKYSRNHLYRVRKGVTEPTRPVMKAITYAVGSLLGRKVRVSELFALGDGSR